MGKNNTEIKITVAKKIACCKGIVFKSIHMQIISIEKFMIKSEIKRLKNGNSSQMKQSNVGYIAKNEM